MALLFMDGFSHYTTAEIERKWTTRNNSYVTWSIETGGRTAGCLKRTNLNNNGGNIGSLIKAPFTRQTGPWSIQNRGVMGFAIKIDDLSKCSMRVDNGGLVKAQYETLFTVWNAEWAQFGVGVNSDGTLSLYNGPGGNHMATSINALQNNTWAFLEFKWFINATAGTFVARANGIEILNYTGRLFTFGAPGNPLPTDQWTSVTCFQLSSTAGAPYLTFRVCDFYLLDTTGTFNNDFLGDISIAVIVPDAPGFATAWTPNAGANWSNVNEVPSNGDTSYNSALLPDLMDLYSYQPITLNPRAIQQCIMTRRVAVGAATLESVVRHSGVQYKSPAQAVQLETAYSYILYPYDTNPATGVRFTAADVNAGEFGVNKAT